MEYLIVIASTVAAEVIAYYICKWLDGDRQ